MSWHIIWTLLLIICFIGIVIWAYSSSRKEDFEQAANLPLNKHDSLQEPDPKNKGGKLND